MKAMPMLQISWGCPVLSTSAAKRENKQLPQKREGATARPVQGDHGARETALSNQSSELGTSMDSSTNTS